MVLIAVHLRKIGGEWRLAVWATNESIQETNFLFPLSVVVAVEVFEPVWVRLLIIFALVPTCLAIVWDSEYAAVGKRNRDYKVFHKDWNHPVFVFLGIHKGKSVVVMHHDDGDALTPDIEHCLVNDFSQGGLRIVGNGFTECGWVRASAKEPAFAIHEGDEITFLAKGFIDVGLPALVGWEGFKVFGLELANKVEVYFGLFGQCLRFASIITSMSEFLTHKSICVMSVIRRFGDMLI